MTEDLAEANELCPALLLPCNPDAGSSVWGTPADLKPVFDTQFQGVPSDNYVSGFTGYHAVWYNAWKSDSCKAGWHTHVDYGITVANASKAIKLQLEELIKWLDAQ